MNTRDFIKRRAMIERRHTSQAKRNAAMRRLVREAGAAVIVMQGKVTGWRMKNGQVVCMKHRHRDHDHAEAELMRIKAANWNGHRVPMRAYACQYCRGWHLTSQPAQHENAA